MKEVKKKTKKKVKVKIDERKVKEIKKKYLKEIEFNPNIYFQLKPAPQPRPHPRPHPHPEPDYHIRQSENTMYEGSVLYLKYWNYWIRAGIRADDRANIFFPDFENSNQRIFDLISDIGVTTAPSSGEPHIWEKIADVWKWIGENVTSNNEAYSSISTQPHWPSIDDLASYYEDHGNLVWAACFSKAHLFASILGRVGIPRWRITIAESHHTVGGAPPTATHVFVAVYVAEQWFFLDPTWVYAIPELAEFGDRESVGLFEEVDYEHPYKTIPIPLSDFGWVPLIPR